MEAEGAGEIERLDAVLLVAGGRDGEQDVPGLSEGFDLALEDVVEGVVVAYGGEDAGVGGAGSGDAGDVDSLSYVVERIYPVAGIAFSEGTRRR